MKLSSLKNRCMIPRESPLSKCLSCAWPSLHLISSLTPHKTLTHLPHLCSQTRMMNHLLFLFKSTRKITYNTFFPQVDHRDKVYLGNGGYSYESVFHHAGRPITGPRWEPAMMERVAIISWLYPHLWCLILPPPFGCDPCSPVPSASTLPHPR